MQERLRQLRCEDRVRFAGLLDRAALLDALRSADLCLLPSLTESFCKARLDAMLCGVPVLTTEVGFGRTLVGADGERGWIVPAGSPEAIARGVAAVLEGPLDWPGLRRRCRDFVTHLTLEAWAARIQAICREQWGVATLAGRLTAQR